jgi:hypothetical protein
MSSTNSYQHGLAGRFVPSRELKEIVDRLADEIADYSSHPIVRSNARCAAEAMLELFRIRWIKNEMIKGAIVFADLASKGDGDQIISTEFDVPIELAIRQSWLSRCVSFLKARKPKLHLCLEPLPAKEPARSAEAIRRMLPQLCKLERYERRAASRRDRAIRDMAVVQNPVFVVMKRET